MILMTTKNKKEDDDDEVEYDEDEELEYDEEKMMKDLPVFLEHVKDVLKVSKLDLLFGILGKMHEVIDTSVDSENITAKEDEYKKLLDRLQEYTEMEEVLKKIEREYINQSLPEN